MVKAETVSVSVNTRQQLPNGLSLFATELARKTEHYGSTALHEAEHAVPAEVVGDEAIEASNQPRGNALGITRTARISAVSALGPHANGRSGTSHDLRVASMVAGDIGSAMRVAKTITDSHKEEIEEVAVAIEKKGTVYNFDIKEAMKAGRKRREDKIKEENTQNKYCH